MFARVVTVQVQPGKADEATSIYRDSVVPAGKQQKGHSGFMMLVDPNTGKGLSIALWETEADMKAGEASGYLQQQLAKFASLLAAAPVTEHYEVRVQS
ncbi:MAG: antibiotic biosynthesis monooxygenase [Dehalococcoidia bacterium]|nr:antibiotic biosynthesis monooxygenase [Dehalococcoidia bacterium]